MSDVEHPAEVPADKPTLRTRLLVWVSVLVAMDVLFLALAVVVVWGLAGQPSPQR